MLAVGYIISRVQHPESIWRRVALDEHDSEYEANIKRERPGRSPHTAAHIGGKLLAAQSCRDQPVRCKCISMTSPLFPIPLWVLGRRRAGPPIAAPSFLPLRHQPHSQVAARAIHGQIELSFRLCGMYRPNRP